MHHGPPHDTGKQETAGMYHGQIFSRNYALVLQSCMAATVFECDRPFEQACTVITTGWDTILLGIPEKGPLRTNTVGATRRDRTGDLLITETTHVKSHV